MSFLHNLKNKPDSYKKTFSFVMSGSITMVIFSVWLVSFVHSASSGAIAEQSVQKSFSPLNVIKEQFSTIIDDVVNQTAGMNFSDPAFVPTEDDLDAVATSSFSNTSIDAPIVPRFDSFATTSQVVEESAI